MRKLADGVHVQDAPQRFAGVEVGARMTLLETDDGVLVHSPLAVDPASVADIGPARWVMAPNKLHHLYVGPWIEAVLEAWAAPGLPEKRRDLAFTGVLDTHEHPFGDAIEVFPLASFPFTNEVAVLHRPSRTLVLADLVLHITRDYPWTTRAAMTLLWGYPGCCTTILERVGFHRPTARREMAMLAELDFDRLVMAHGEVIETGGKEAFRGAMGWLGI
ncbi:MAG: hypothetical protein AAF602_00280 [Myxococcota bacterium]